MFFIVAGCTTSAARQYAPLSAPSMTTIKGLKDYTSNRPPPVGIWRNS